jgi:chloramphenicol 3-O-phosphotransferase
MLGGARRDHGSLPSACTSAAGCCWLHTVIDEYLFRMLPSIPPAPTRSKRSQYLGTKYLKKKDERFFLASPKKGEDED